MAHKTNFMMGLQVYGGVRGGKTALLTQPTRLRDPLRAKRAALVERLKAGADAADRGETVKCTGMTADEIIAALKAR